MAERYSGKVRIRVRWEEGIFPGMNHGGRYRCNVRTPEGRTTIFVGAPVYITEAVDSSAAYDESAHAALSFAMAEEEEEEARHSGEDHPRVSSYVASKPDGSGWHVGRSPDAAWPRAQSHGRDLNVVKPATDARFRELLEEARTMIADLVTGYPVCDLHRSPQSLVAEITGALNDRDALDPEDVTKYEDLP